jgi:MYXO-CTERM domain-containing protein
VVVSGGDVFRGSPGIFTQTTPMLMWWDVGGEVLALAVVLLLVMRRRRAGESPSSRNPDQTISSSIVN